MSPGPGPSGVAPKIPRPIQTSGAAMIAAAAADGWRQFLLCDDVGTGKTITLWLGALAVARGVSRILGAGRSAGRDHHSALAKHHRRDR